jgi:ribonucleoside-diphosphate reductase alpha chain
MLDARDAVDSGRGAVSKSSRGRLAQGRGRETRGRVRPGEGAAGALAIRRLFTADGRNPFDAMTWEKRKASIADDKGQTIFEQDGVEVPSSWSQLATNVVASKYFYGAHGSPEREFSLRQLVGRVTRTIADWGLADGLFASPADAEAFHDELSFLCLNQYGSFNSPVWFNCGLYQQYRVGRASAAGNFHCDKRTGEVRRAASQYEYPQCSACFIQSVKDSMDSIMELARSEAMLFKFGSGTGTDLSTLRSARERLSGGGTPSGPLSFLKVYDAIASVVKSGGKTRRAAKMNTLKCWHPDIKEFIEAKTLEERKAWAMIEQGYSGSFNGEAYGSVSFQNENLSVRVTDAFLQAVEKDQEWRTHLVTDPSKPGPAYRARDLMRWIAEGTWTCGDPGVQYEDTINRWHTCKADGPINSSNPCSEYMFLDDSACNLASLNLMKFLNEDGMIDLDRFRHAVEIFVTAQEILVDNGSYPTERIASNSHRYRPLGLGFANLGSLLMASGLAYDSDDGRALAAALTAVMHARAYAHSARLASFLGPFERFTANRECMMEVIEQHRLAARAIDGRCPAYLRQAAAAEADRAVDLGRRHGYRNAQVTVLAPTGTIGFMMDCDTTGIEPDIALVKYKTLAGGGLLKIVNRTVPAALKRLGYAAATVDAIVRHVDERDTIEGAPGLDDSHLPVFDCAFAPRNGRRFIPYMAHLRMMSAVQPFLSGAISKTVNMSEPSTVEEIMATYLAGWKLGLKAVAIYRDGSKRSQPVNTGKEKAPAPGEAKGEAPAPAGGNGSKARPLRRRMPATRRSITHKFDIAGHEGYLTVGLYDDNSPGELFITMAKEGSTVGGLMDCFGTAISLCLQYGVPLKTLVEKFAHSRFEPSGFTKNPDIPIAKSLTDYIFRWLGQTFLDTRDEGTPAEAPAPAAPRKVVDVEPAPPAADAAPRPPKARPGALSARVDAQFRHFMEDAPACDQCGAITVRNGACYKCFNCGNSMGCS